MYFEETHSRTARAAAGTERRQRAGGRRLCHSARAALTALTLLVALDAAFAQSTKIDLESQSRNPDFSAFPFTRPVSVGGSLPPTCQVGQLFLNSAAEPGANLFACTASNSWNSLGTGAITLDQVGNPAANKVFHFYNAPNATDYTLGFLFGSNTGVSPALSIADAASNTGTASLVQIATGPGSAASPFEVKVGSITAFNVDRTGVLSTQGLVLSPSGLNNVLQYAPGITISDGAVHTIGTAPSGTVFHGVASLAGVAGLKINGAQPFAWITSQTSPFAFSGSLYNLTDAKVPNIDIGWLAIQTALLTGKTYIPAGTYVIGSDLPLPLYIPLNQEQTGVIRSALTIIGDGESASIIKAGSDFGTGYPLLSCGDPSGTSSNSLGRYSGNGAQCSGDIENLGLWSSSGSAFSGVGTVSINMDGFYWGARLRNKDVEVAGFNHNWNLVGDHTLFIRPRSTGGTYGIYFAPPNTALFGDLQFLDTLIIQPSIAGIYYDGAASDIDNIWLGVTYIGGTPYAILGASNGCSDILLGSHFDYLMTELIGNAVIADDHNYSGGVYNDTNKCRQVQKTIIAKWFTLYTNKYFWGGGRGRRATWDIAGGDWTINYIHPAGSNASPNSIPAPNGPTPVAAFNVNGTGNVKLAGNVSDFITDAGSLQLFSTVNPTTVFLDNGTWSGGITYTYPTGNLGTVTAGDCIESEQYFATACGTSYTSSPSIIGVALQSGLTWGQNVPFANTGQASANFLWNASTWGSPKRSLGIRGLNLTPGAGYTNGTYALTFSGCSTSPAGSVTVAGGVLSSYVLTSTGICTATPNVSVPAGAGTGSGGAIMAIWPSALFTMSTGYTDLPRAGTNISVGGAASGGTANSIVLLQGLR